MLLGDGVARGELALSILTSQLVFGRAFTSASVLFVPRRVTDTPGESSVLVWLRGVACLEGLSFLERLAGGGDNVKCFIVTLGCKFAAG